MIRIKTLIRSLFFIFPCLLVNCKPDTEFISDGQAYLQLVENDQRVYKVKHVVYTAANETPQTNEYFEKHIVTSVKEVNGVLFGTIIIYKSDALSGKWIESELYMIEKRPDKVIQIKNGVITVVLDFPVKNERKWDPNTFNNLPVTSIFYSKVDSDFQIEEQSWNNTISLVELEKSTLIDLYSKYKVFSVNKGLVYEEDIALEYCQETNCIGQEIIDSGYRYTKTLVE